jgi:hypothetical protein
LKFKFSFSINCLRAVENKELRRIFGPKSGEITENEEKYVTRTKPYVFHNE